MDSIGSNSEDELLRDFPEVGRAAGTLPGEYRVRLEESARGVVRPPRRLAASLRKKMISFSETKYTKIQDYTRKELSMLSQVIMKGWPDTRSETPIEVRAFWARETNYQLQIA